MAAEHSASSFDDFDFKLGSSPHQNSSAVVPLIIDGNLQPTADSRSGIAQQEPSQRNEGDSASRTLPEHSQSVRARRRPTDAELRLPDSQQDVQDNLAPREVARANDPSYSLFPIKSPARLRTPAPSSTFSHTTPRMQNLIDADRIMTGSPTAPTLPPTPSSGYLQLVPDRVLNLPLPHQSASPSAHSPAATNDAKSPDIPPRSMERQLHSKSNSNKETIDIGSSALQQATASNSHAQSIMTPPKTGSLPSSAGDRASDRSALTLDDKRDLPRAELADRPRSRQPSQNERSDESVQDVPSTPKTTHKRNDSGTGSPRSRGRHASSKSFEAAPYINEDGLGSPVTTFENDLSRAFNLSPNTHTTVPGGATSAGLERSNTITRMANKMLKHRKSVSGSALSPKLANANRRGSVSDAALEIVALQEELRIKNDRIYALETTVRQGKDSKVTEDQLEARKSLLATIESQIVETGAEHQSFLHHRHSASDTKIPLGTWKAKVVSEMDQSIRKVKDELSAEIATLLRERNDLQLENETLESRKTAHIHDLAILEKKQHTLSNMNDSMLRQIQAGMEANKVTKPVSRGLSDVSVPSLQGSSINEGNDLDSKLTADTLDREPLYALSNSTSRELQTENEEDIVVGSAIRRLSSERIQDATSPKKMNLVKKTKRAFRWGRNGNSGSDSTYNNFTNGVPASERTMSSSKSSDKLSTKPSGGMFKRTWQSQQNLSSHLEHGSPRNSSSQFGTAPMFGSDLSVQLESEGRQVPQLVTSCINVIETRALDFEGLYRKSGGASEMKALIEAFETANLANNSVDFTNFQDISAITSVMKQYLRRLPIPLINFDAYEPFLGTSAIPDSGIRIRAVQDVLRDLPPPHYHTLRALFRHLLTVSQHSDKNLMTTKNLAVVLGPTVIWDQAGDKEITDMHDKNSCIQFCIEHADKW